MPEIVVTAVGPDRPGLVGEFTGPIFAAEANLADTRMVNLRGQFAMLLLVEGPEAALAKLRQSLPELGARLGLAVGVTAPGAQAPRREGVPWRIKTYSMDQPGIVHRVSSVLQKHGVNIEDLDTRLESGPFMGAPLFTLELTALVPGGVQVKALRRDLEALADQLNCDVDLEPA